MLVKGRESANCPLWELRTELYYRFMIVCCTFYRSRLGHKLIDGIFRESEV
jgi:hypothetical protein